MVDGVVANPEDETTFINCGVDADGCWQENVQTCPPSLVFEPLRGRCYYRCERDLTPQAEEDCNLMGVSHENSNATYAESNWFPLPGAGDGNCFGFRVCSWDTEYEDEWIVCERECGLDQNGRKMVYNTEFKRCIEANEENPCLSLALPRIPPDGFFTCPSSGLFANEDDARSLTYFDCGRDLEYEVEMCPQPGWMFDAGRKQCVPH